jgi:formate hydrogenlyase transcriptional activator
MGADIQRNHANGTIQPPVLGGGSTDASERRRPVDELEERLRFETLLSDLSARFINLPAEDVDKEVEAVLSRIVEFLGLDRSTIFQFSEDETIMQVSHCWAAPGFESLKGLIPRDVFPWALARVLQGHTIVYSCVDELPEEAAWDKATVRRVGPKSNVTFPLTAGAGAVFGALAFGQMARERSWPANLVQRLRLVSQIVANALLRRRSEQKLRQALAEIKQLKERLVQENVYLRQEASLSHGHENVIGQSQALKEALALVEQVAGAAATVLLLGETGTGKELLATAIHNMSSRRERTMVKVN